MTVEIEEKPILSIASRRTSHTHNVYCKRCNNTSVSRIPRGPLVKLFLFWLPLKRYVCYRCHRKSYRWKPWSKQQKI